MNEWMSRHPLETYLLIYVLLTIVYVKVFRVKGRMPLWKEFIVYGLLAIFAFILLIFQIDRQLPIVASLLVAIVLMVIVWIRSRLTRRFKRQDRRNQA